MPMNNIVNQRIQIDNWVFEVKMVRALRVQNYGEPYSAIANIKLNGNNAYIDGMMQKNLQQFSNEDLQIIKKYCRRMSIHDIVIEPTSQDVIHQPIVQQSTLFRSA
tara:strand:+ start:1086 stop:1403 length:318 start_codon:yes stop_codon:yes gene_type:complete